MVPLCSCCPAPGKLKCSGCTAVGLNVPYCSVKHQKLLWPTHKLICGRVLTAPYFPPLRKEELINFLHVYRVKDWEFIKNPEYTPQKIRALNHPSALASMLEETPMIALEDRYDLAKCESSIIYSSSPVTDAVAELGPQKYLDALEYQWKQRTEPGGRFASGVQQYIGLNLLRAVSCSHRMWGVSDNTFPGESVTILVHEMLAGALMGVDYPLMEDMNAVEYHNAIVVYMTVVLTAEGDERPTLIQECWGRATLALSRVRRRGHPGLDFISTLDYVHQALGKSHAIQR